MQALLIYLLSALGLVMDHDIHVGVCDIKVKDTQVEVVVKTFIDDLQIAVGLEPGKPLPEDYTSAEELISEYVTSIIQLQLDNQLIDFTLEDISSSTGDAVWLTLNGNIESADLTSMKCGFELLTDIYDDQTNIINVYHKESKEIFALNTKKVSFTYEPD